jgi:hypothetical protein
MSTGRPASSERPVLLALDHLFIPSQEDPAVQAVYDALGALDAACPEAIATLSADDLTILIRAALAWTRTIEPEQPEPREVMAAAGRLAHVLERFPRREFDPRRGWPAIGYQAA